MGQPKFFAALGMSTFASDLENTANIDFEVTYKFQQIGNFTNIESADNDCLACIYFYL